MSKMIHSMPTSVKIIFKRYKNSFQGDKSLVIDGRTIELLEGFFKEIREYLSLVVEEPRSMGNDFRSFNSTFIANNLNMNKPLLFHANWPISLTIM